MWSFTDLQCAPKWVPSKKMSATPMVIVLHDRTGEAVTYFRIYYFGNSAYLNATNAKRSLFIFIQYAG